MLPAQPLLIRMHMIKTSSIFLAILVVAFVQISCNPLSTAIFSKKTLREKYEDKLRKDSGKNNPTVNAWLNAAEHSLQHPLKIPSTYVESGKFTANNHTATSLQVFVKRGQKLMVQLNKTSAMPFAVYLDLWQAADSLTGAVPKYILASDTAINNMEYVAIKDENLLIRYQSQISTHGSYMVSVKAVASFSFPIAANVKSNIGSFWGAGRDGGARKHEGIDIFAPAKSPAVAVADGYITSVTENVLGGKVIFMQPFKTSYNVYYAHLDEQLVITGQQVKAGDVIGLIGNTGNAKTTAPHLHFGIYTIGGAIDPLAFVEKQRSNGVTAAPTFATTGMITTKTTKLYADLAMQHPIGTLEKSTSLQAEAFNGKHYRVVLPDGRKAFAEAKNLTIQTEKNS